jgi:hypothetical protein
MNQIGTNEIGTGENEKKYHQADHSSARRSFVFLVTKELPRSECFVQHAKELPNSSHILLARARRAAIKPSAASNAHSMRPPPPPPPPLAAPPEDEEEELDEELGAAFARISIVAMSFAALVSFPARS